MNKVILSLRLTKDPTIKYNGEMCIARFTGAVDRRFKKDGQQSADFPSCVAFGKTAEFCEKWAKKGMKFNVVGRLTTGSYKDKDDRTVYTTEVTVEEIEFGESKGQSEIKSEKPDEGFTVVPDDESDELPFN